jgi:hypothetical protein
MLDVLNKHLKTNSARYVVIVISIIVLLGIFVRLFNLTEVYSEVDDIGVISAYKVISTDKKNVSIYESDILDVKAIVDKNNITNSLLESYLFPIYMGFNWTYPPGQYIFYPIFIDENDSYNLKIFKGRLISSIVSILSLLLFLKLLYILSEKKINASWIIPLSVFAFSFNSVMYSHHMSTYAMTLLTSLIYLLSYHNYIVKKENDLLKFSFICAILSYFNYLIALFIIPSLVIYIYDNRQNIETIMQKVLLSVAIYVAITAPMVAVFLKPSYSTGHNHATAFSDISEGVLVGAYNLLSILAEAGGSIIASFTTNMHINSFLFFVILLSSFYSLKKSNDYFHSFVVKLSISFILLWTVLYMSGNIIMSPSRHVIMWLLPIVILLWSVLKYLKIHSGVLILIGLIFAYIGTNLNVNHIINKGSVYDFDLIDNQSHKIIFSYYGTLKPILYYDNKDKEVIYTNSKSFIEKYVNNLQISPNKALLTSAECSFECYKDTQAYYERKKFWEQYELREIAKEETWEYFTFNNIKITSNPNNFYLYEMVKK